MDIYPAASAAEYADEVRAITALVADVEKSQQNERPEDFVALFGTDPVWVTGNGVRLDGWDTISEFTHRVLPGAMDTSTAAYEPVRISFVRPDVAVVSIVQRRVTLDGEIIPDHPEGRPTYVLANGDDGWRIVAGQNTLVQSSS